MPEPSTLWSVPPAELVAPGLALRPLPPLPQALVSGDLDGFLARHAMPPALGLLAAASGPRYALRLARNRMLAVGVAFAPEAAGWADGVAVTPMTGAYAVLEIAGPRAMDLVQRGTAIDPRSASPGAALVFAGVDAVLYRHGAGLRLHLDRGLQPYLLSWAAATGLFGPG